jgi:flagellar hook protein FlgE
MFTAFNTALTALRANSTAVNVIGNNLANLNTTGYKASEVQFSDLMAQTMGTGSTRAQIGLGLGSVTTYREFTQGSVQTTNNPLDAAITGNGFFVVKGANNQQLFTRAGSFQVDTNGNLITATGEKVQGWSAVGGTVNPTGAVGNITVPLSANLAALPTTTMSMNVNLASSTPTTGTAASFSAPIQVVDAQGSSHTLTVTYTKTDVNSWKYSVTIPPQDLTGYDPKADPPAKPKEVASGTLSFDDHGKLTSPDSKSDPIDIKIAGLGDGAADMDIKWNLYDSAGNATLTQFDQASGVASTNQDGVAAGQISGVSIQDGGILVASFTNGQQSTIGQLALATITNPESLVAVGNNELAASAATSQPAIGTANSAGRGQIVGGSLESSTVDMAQQFTELLTVQRSYQASSRIITTSDQLLQDTVNLIHP